MSVRVQRGGRGLAAEAIRTLTTWAPRHAAAAGLHAGDVGWHLRLDDADLEETLAIVRDGGDAVAVALIEPGMVRPTVRHDRTDDLDVARALGELVASIPTSEGAACDAATDSALRAWLVANGWEIDPDPWALLYRPLSTADHGEGEALAEPLSSDDDVADRVAVQFNAFERSTFTVPRWRQMAAGPGYRAELDLLRRDQAGVPVAAATGWAAGPGKVAILEPVGTHREHVRRGHGRAVTPAVIGALARAGASGVAVQTPESNPAAVRAYEACGMRRVDSLHALRRIS
jgi:GNAT superfamily N-acetyltransferase